jgi:hypothetical protein
MFTENILDENLMSLVGEVVMPEEEITQSDLGLSQGGGCTGFPSCASCHCA